MGKSATRGFARMRDKFPAIPTCVLGVGLYRVWTETVYVNTSIEFPSEQLGSFPLFNVISILALVFIAHHAKRLSPLCAQPGVFPLTAVLMGTSAVMNFSSVAHPEAASLLALPAVVCGGVGVSLIMMLWSEFYGAINPFRTALYYSASIVLGAVVLWAFKGLAFWWLCVGAVLVPIVSLVYLKRSLDLLPPDEQPHAAWAEFQFPIKPVALVALYSFAYGLRESVFFSNTLGPHSAFGVILPAAFVFVGMALFRETFRLSLVWKLALPFMLLSLIPSNLTLFFGQSLSDFCALAGYTAYLILIMVVLSNLSYRYGICALWLFAIERAVRLTAVLFGLGVSDFVRGTMAASWAEPLISAGVFLAVVGASVLFFSEKQLRSSWGIVLNESPSNQEEILIKNRLGTKCHEIARQFKLSSREEEILVLLVQQKKRSSIERELFIAASTLKTHIRHIYQKLDIHSKEELFELAGVK